jgi:hypothetical protein
VTVSSEVVVFLAVVVVFLLVAVFVAVVVVFLLVAVFVAVVVVFLLVAVFVLEVVFPAVVVARVLVVVDARAAVVAGGSELGLLVFMNTIAPPPATASSATIASMRARGGGVVFIAIFIGRQPRPH